MRTVPVDSYPVVPTFNSVAAAIRHAKAYPPLAQAQADEQQLLGADIVDGFWTDTEFAIRFSNNRFLHIWVEPEIAAHNLSWSVLEVEPRLQAGEIGRVGAATVLLGFPKIGTFRMDRSALLAARRGKPLRKLFVNEVAFYVYTPQQRILCFGCVRRRDTGENLLYVHEDD